MILASVSPFFAEDAVALNQAAASDSLWQREAKNAALAYERDLYTDDAIWAVQQARRILRIFMCGLEKDATFKASLEKAPLSDWIKFSESPVTRALQDSLADKLYIVQDVHDVPLIEIGDQARYIGAKLVEKCVADKLAFDISISDDNFSALLMNAASDDAVSKLAAYFIVRREKINMRILVHHNLPEWTVLETDPAKQKLYRGLLAPYRARVLSGKMRSVLTSIPTKRDADVEGMTHKDYAELYFRMCDQPWDLIKDAQYKLIATLNAGKILRFTNDDGTDLTMDIDGFTFCNSIIARNIPGSEAFSAPRIDSTNGVIVAKGKFSPKDDAGSLIENITLRFKDGILTEWKADKGQETLDKTLSVDDGAKRIGEIGIGTNPYLKQHVASILLSEKIGGSFHVALGDAYTMTDYMGDPVHVDNGNRSQLHWDVTTMLYGKGGKIILDGTPIMENGLFLDPALDVLNRGWRAVPFDQRPAEWQKIYPDK